MFVVKLLDHMVVIHDIYILLTLTHVALEP